MTVREASCCVNLDNALLYVDTQRIYESLSFVSKPPQVAAVDPQQIRQVAGWLQKNSRRRAAAIRTWIVLLAEACPDTGAIPLTRKELAGKAGVSEDDLSSIMMELARCNAASRQKKGREVSYFVDRKFFVTPPSETQEDAGATIESKEEEEAEEEPRPGSKSKGLRRSLSPRVGACTMMGLIMLMLLVLLSLAGIYWLNM